MNESVSVNDYARTLWKAEMENENGYGYEHLLTRACESDCGRLGELT